MTIKDEIARTLCSHCTDGTLDPEDWFEPEDFQPINGEYIKCEMPEGE